MTRHELNTLAALAKQTAENADWLYMAQRPPQMEPPGDGGTRYLNPSYRVPPGYQRA